MWLLKSFTLFLVSIPGDGKSILWTRLLAGWKHQLLADRCVLTNENKKEKRNKERGSNGLPSIPPLSLFLSFSFTLFFSLLEDVWIIFFRSTARATLASVFYLRRWPAVNKNRRPRPTTVYRLLDAARTMQPSRNCAMQLLWAKEKSLLLKKRASFVKIWRKKKQEKER